MSASPVSDASYNALLRQSKVLRLSSQRPVAVTAPASYRHRNDFGLKHALPRKTKRSPFLYVRSLDAASGIGSTDFRPATADALLVQKLHAVGATAQPLSANQLDPLRREDGANDAAIPLLRPERLQSMAPPAGMPRNAQELARWSGKDAAARKRLERKAPDVQALSDEAFHTLLSLIRKPGSGLRRRFREYCQRKAKEEVETAAAEMRSTNEQNKARARLNLADDEQFPFRLPGDQETVDRWVTGFLAEPEVLDMLERARIVGAADEPRSSLHPTLGLTYSLPSSFHAAVEAMPVRARRMRTGELGQASQAAVLGVVGKVTGKDSGHQFVFDNAAASQSKETKAEQGLGRFRFASVEVKAPDFGPDDRDVRSASQELAPFEELIARLADSGQLPFMSRSVAALRKLPRTVPVAGVNADVFEVDNEVRERDRVPIGTPAYVVHGGVVSALMQTAQDRARAAADAARMLQPARTAAPRNTHPGWGSGYLDGVRNRRQAKPPVDDDWGDAGKL